MSWPHLNLGFPRYLDPVVPKFPRYYPSYPHCYIYIVVLCNFLSLYSWWWPYKPKYIKFYLTCFVFVKRYLVTLIPSFCDYLQCFTSHYRPHWLRFLTFVVIFSDSCRNTDTKKNQTCREVTETVFSTEVHSLRHQKAAQSKGNLHYLYFYFYLFTILKFYPLNINLIFQLVLVKMENN
jgi:hypothetical protein